MTFAKRNSAERALRKYQGVTLDGKAMKLEILEAVHPSVKRYVRAVVLCEGVLKYNHLLFGCRLRRVLTYILFRVCVCVAVLV